ncbi:phospholipase D4 [Chanos chanos]|uniref:Phospholipase D4 n=1 Tax=Chanos chanos TaxID=29144 RepID=A0A6J2UQG2_CHACN|nr:phospholipase D4 [Chanos chanos]
MSEIIVVESIPLDMKYEVNATFGTPLYKAWSDLLSMAEEQVDIASFYWSLTGEDINVNSSTDQPGRNILEQIKYMPSRNVSVRVVTSIPTLASNSTDLKVLRQNGVQVRRVNFGHLTGGILHTKFWIVDRKHLYIGSANMDWRSLTQVKEVGAVIYNCSHLASDLHKIFLSYWVMGHRNASLPNPWPSSFDTLINQEKPLLVNLSGVPSQVYISGSPPVFCPHSRTKDLDAILSAIAEAERFIHIALMEYLPLSQFSRPKRYWPVIDDAIRGSVFERNVSVRLLVSCGRNSDPTMLPFLQSLAALQYPDSNVHLEVKIYIVPVGNHSDIPYARVNHNKYMVTDKVAYVGTSNWSADYFSSTAGVGLVVSHDTINSTYPRDTFQEQLKKVFERDWESEYSVPLASSGENPDCAFWKIQRGN